MLSLGYEPATRRSKGCTEGDLKRTGPGTAQVSPHSSLSMLSKTNNCYRYWIDHAVLICFLIERILQFLAICVLHNPHRIKTTIPRKSISISTALKIDIHHASWLQETAHLCMPLPGGGVPVPLAHLWSFVWSRSRGWQTLSDCCRSETAWT